MKTAQLKRYFIVGGKLLCFIPRTGSTSLLKLIETKHYPYLSNIKGITPHFKTPSIIDDHKSELVSMFRCPIERFISGCAQKKWNVAEGIAELKKEIVDIHIRPQNTFLSDNRPTKLFRFPEQLDACAAYLGLPTPIPHLNKSKVKPTASAEELAWLTEYYKKDLEIFNSI
jgi:hypothetical protein